MNLKMCLKNTVNTAVGIIRCGLRRQMAQRLRTLADLPEDDGLVSSTHWLVHDAP